MSRRFAWVPRHVEPIGIDFGSRVVRMLQLAGQRSQLTVIACAQRLLPPGPHTPAEYDVLRKQAVTEMLQDAHFVGRRVTTALSWDDLQVRNIRVPTMPENEIAEVIRFEASERFGMEPDEAELRFIVAGDVRQGTELRQELIVLGTQTAAVQRHVALLEGMGLEPAAIDAGPCALFRGFERFLRRDEDSNEVNAFVDLGHSATRVVLSRGPELIFFKSIPVGGAKFDEIVSDRLDLNPTEASNLRRRLHIQYVATLTGQELPAGEEPVGETTRRAVVDALRGPLEQLSKEIALCLRYCSVTFRGLRSSEVTVIGGEACNSDILRILSDQVNLPFQVGRPMRGIGCDSDFDGADRRTGQPEWAMALGLALKPAPCEAEVPA